MSRPNLILYTRQTIVLKGFSSCVSKHSKHVDFQAVSKFEQLIAKLQTTKQCTLVLLSNESFVDDSFVLTELKIQFPFIKIVVITPAFEMKTYSAFLQTAIDRRICSESPEDVIIKSLLEMCDIDLSIANSEKNNVAMEADTANLALTKRESQILALICQGKFNKEIASELGITISTVDYHKRNISIKTGKTSKVELLLYAMKNSIIH